MRLLCFFFTIFVFSPIFGQTPTLERVPGEILVSLGKGILPDSFAKKMDFEISNRGSVFQKKGDRSVFSKKNIWLFSFDESQISGNNLLEKLRHQPDVLEAQFNFLLENRGLEGGIYSACYGRNKFRPPTNLPNDPYFSYQYYLKNNSGGADLAAEKAWDITTGGVTPAGDTIIICVIDGGFDFPQADFAGNLWKNNLEIPNDGLDNDQNGFTDDSNGWNFLLNNDSPNGYFNQHGSAVAGIIGARGNNGKGISGVNWQVKIMPIVCPGNVGGILSAYDYTLKMRELYNQTDGKRGAFIVATNASWGINFGQPADAPLWCGVYDFLGNEGILNIAATANSAINVDTQGDLPTACPSNYLIAVTSVDAADQHVANSGFGKKHIDLAGFGENIYTMLNGNQCGKQSGTSFAAPQVTGAVGLLYAAPCPNLIAIAKINPAAATFTVRKMLLENVSPNASLAGITVSGGRLDLQKLLEKYQNGCAACPAPFGLKLLAATDSSMLLDWSELSDFQRVDLKYRNFDTGSFWSKIEEITPPVWVQNLEKCTFYEISLKSECATAESIWSGISLEKTAGCCAPPDDIFLQNQTSTASTLEWSGYPSAAGYKLRLRPENAPDWQFFDCGTAQISLLDLPKCTRFEVQIQSNCPGGATVFSPSFYFQTAGCGACTELDYCFSASQNALFEWVNEVKIGDWASPKVGVGGAGYQNLTMEKLSDTLVLHPKTKYAVLLTPGFAGSATQNYFRVFADLNLDGDFLDADEMIFDPGFSHDGALPGEFKTPDFLPPGISRLRVVMKKFTNLDTPPLPCGTFQSGQVVDFCVRFSDEMVSDFSFKNENAAAPQVFPNPTTGDFFVKMKCLEGETARFSLFDAAGRLAKSVVFKNLPTGEPVLKMETSGLPGGFYFLKMEKNGEVWRAKMAINQKS